MIIKDITKFSKKKWDEGYDSVLVGHYHQTGINNYGNKKLIYLGDWLSKYTVTVFDDNNCWQGNWEQFIDLS